MQFLLWLGILIAIIALDFICFLSNQLERGSTFKIVGIALLTVAAVIIGIATNLVHI